MKDRKISIKYSVIIAFGLAFIAGVCLYYYNVKAEKDNKYFIAASDGDIEAITEILRQGKDVNSTTCDGSSALLFASHENHIDVVRLLLNNNINPNTSNKNGSTALNYAIGNGNYNIVNLLLDSGAPANQYIAKSIPALHYAVQENHKDIVKLLIDKGADVNMAYFGDITPLSTAVSHADADMVELLLLSGARPDAKSIAYAATKGNEKIIELLKNAVSSESIPPPHNDVEEEPSPAGERVAPSFQATD
jgi:ankyrin repeat protein